MTITLSPRWKRIATLIFGITMLGSLIAMLQSVHQSIHQENQCQMTFMWRRINMIPIVVPNNTVKTYGLYRYHEGDPSGIFFSTPSTIPVLFVPGSGGSANQVRSIGSVMQNKTELRSLPYRFHFYSIDFDEELTFLSGHTVKRQRDFVIKSISAVLNVYKGSDYSIDKLVLIGHSFGGSIVLSLAAEDFPTRTAIDLILTKASPINAPPIMMDNSMRLFYSSMNSAVENTGNTKLDKVAIVSWSGGLKDYQISDRLSKLESSSNSMQGVYFPLWALDDVRMDTDHLCILWCNQFVKHESRLLQAYAENWISKDGDTNVYDVVNKFYMNQLAMHKEVFSNLSPLHTRRVHPLLWPWDKDMYDFTSDAESNESVQYFTITSETPETVLKVELRWSGARCKGPTEMYFQFTNGFRRHAVVPKKMKTMVFNVPQTLSALEPLQGKLVIKAKTDCNFNVKFSNNFFWSIYMMFLVYSSLIPHVILDASLCLAAVSLGLDRQLPHSTIIIATNAMLALHLSLAFSVGTGIRFATLHLRMFIVYFIITFTIVEPIKRSLHIIFSPIMQGSQFFCRLFWLLFTIGACLNPHISLGFLLIGLSMLSKSSPSFIGGIFGAAIQIGIGLAGGVRDAFFTTPLFLYIQEHLLYALPFWTCLLFIICSIFEMPRKLLSNHKSSWLFLPVTALLFTFISEKVPLETYACFMVIWLYFNNMVYDLPKPVKEKANSTTRPRQWNDKYKKL